jgi:Domain of unknown function (DUF5666)
MRSRVLVSALVATGVLAAGCGANSTSSPAPTTAPAPSAAPARHAGRNQNGIRGTVTAENGSTWTVTTDARGPFTVTVTPQTAFGTKRDPANAQAFPVGTRVRVAGTVNGTTMTAVRIAAATGGRAGTTASPTAPAAPATAAPPT